MVVEEANITAIMTDVWATMLDSELVPAPLEADRPVLGKTLDGVVSITGQWHGAVVLQVSRRLAARAAKTLFDLDEAEPSLEDMQDTIGEMTNTTAGNIKGLMPGPCHLSLPTVVEGTDYRLRVPGSTVVSELGFWCGEELVVVQLVAAKA